MSSLRDPADAARAFWPTKFVAWLTVGLMLVTIVYAVFMGVMLWPDIGV